MTNSGIVQYILENKPSSRDDDFKFLANFWTMEASERNLNPFNHFLKQFSAGEYLSPLEALKLKQIIQEKHKGLRGKNFKMNEELKPKTNQPTFFDSSKY